MINHVIRNSQKIDGLHNKSIKALHEPARAEPKPGSAQLEKNYASSSLIS
jgi:hypothetical protein